MPEKKKKKKSVRDTYHNMMKIFPVKDVKNPQTPNT